MRRNHHGSAIRRGFVCTALALFSLTAAAATAPASDPAFEKFMVNATGAGETTVNFGKGGVPVSAPSSYSFGPDGGSGIPVSQSGNWKNPAGRDVPITGNARIPNAGAAKAIAKAIGGLIGPISTGMVIYQFVKDIGWDLSRNADGSLKVSKIDPSVMWCTVGPCYQYATNMNLRDYSLAGGTIPYFRTPQLAADWLVGKVVGTGYPGTNLPIAAVTSISDIGSGNYQFCYNVIGFAAPQCGVNFARQTRSVDTGEPPFMGSTIAELEAFIASQSGWPSTSKFADAAREAAKANNEALPTAEPATVTGPATSGSTTTTRTSTNPDGSTRTETETCNFSHTYSGAKITTKETCGTTVTNDGTAGKTTTASVTKDPANQQQAPEKQIDPCQDNPTRVGCMVVTDPAQADIPKREVPLSYTPESDRLGGAACMAPVTWSDTLGAHTLSLQPYCDKLVNVVKPVILALAALTAQFILFGGVGVKS
jgi:hypothetical protein